MNSPAQNLERAKLYIIAILYFSHYMVDKYDTKKKTKQNYEKPFSWLLKFTRL